MEDGNADFTSVFRQLSQTLRNNNSSIRKLFDDPSNLDLWLKKWQKRLQLEKITNEDIAKEMDLVNPIYIPRNHKVEEAINAAVNCGDMNPFYKLLDVINSPFKEIKDRETYAEAGPKNGIPYKTFCGT